MDKFHNMWTVSIGQRQKEYLPADQYRSTVSIFARISPLCKWITQICLPMDRARSTGNGKTRDRSISVWGAPCIYFYTLLCEEFECVLGAYNGFGAASEQLYGDAVPHWRHGTCRRFTSWKSAGRWDLPTRLGAMVVRLLRVCLWF